MAHQLREVPSSCDREFSNALAAHDIPTSIVGFQLFQMSMQDFDSGSTCMKKERAGSVEKTVFRINMYDPEQTRRLPVAAPPPRLHYITFWRSIGRRMYNKHQDDMIQSAREMSPSGRKPLSNK
jgi:hypothetical protein